MRGRLTEVLVCFARRQRLYAVRTYDGAAHVVLTGPSFADLDGVVIAPILHYGAGDSAVVAHLTASLDQTADLELSARPSHVMGNLKRVL